MRCYSLSQCLCQLLIIIVFTLLFCLHYVGSIANIVQFSFQVSKRTHPPGHAGFPTTGEAEQLPRLCTMAGCHSLPDVSSVLMSFSWHPAREALNTGRRHNFLKYSLFFFLKDCVMRFLLRVEIRWIPMVIMSMVLQSHVLLTDEACLRLNEHS